jgi:hypothetical protein
MSNEQKTALGWPPVVLVFVAVAGLAVGALWVWSNYFVNPWAARAALKRELRDYSVPGTYGDAFAPVVGLLTSLALGATVASAYMQREEMREARTQFQAQEREQKRANDLAEEANILALSAQLLEVTRQIADIDHLATAAIAERKREIEAIAARLDGGVTSPRAQHERIGDPGAAWDVFFHASPQQRAQYHRNIESKQLTSLANRRTMLDSTLQGLQRMRAAFEESSTNDSTVAAS